MATSNHESGPSAAQPVVNPEEEHSSSTEQTLSESDSDGSRTPRSSPAPDNSVRRRSRRVSYQRLWSQDDEIAILNGLMAYSTQKQSDPMQDLTTFLDFVKKNLHVNCTRGQLQQKIKRMRHKYEKKKKDGSFPKARDRKVYELSKTVWESGAVGERCKMGRPRGRGKGKAANEGSGSGVFEHGEASGGLEERVVKACAEFFTGEGEWKGFNVEELEKHCKKLEEKLAKSRFVLSVVKASEL